jgi:nitric oxide dioxygenase
MANQANGQQQQSLAAAVFAYAANIGAPEALGPVVSRIVHKHVSLGIKPEHYPIVGRYLIGAIKEVLGDAATPALLAAWDEAYNSLANLFIAAEKEMYATAGIEAGELRPMQVIAVLKQSEDVASIVLAPTDGKPLPAFKPGQYVSCAVYFPDGSRQLRQYSLSDAPDGERLRISVKRERADDGRPHGQVSNWIHDEIAVGDMLHVSHPFGDFTPDTTSAEPIVLLSAGVGITPMIAALNHIARVNPAREVIFAHAARGAGHHAHQADLAAARAVMPNLKEAVFYESAAERKFMEAALLPAWPHAGANVYMCGPVGFMRKQWTDLVAAGVPVERLHREVFGPELLDHLL